VTPADLDRWIPVAVIIIACLFSYFMARLSTFLIVGGTPLQKFVGVITLPATLVMIYASVAAFYFADNPYGGRLSIAIPLSLLHLMLLGCSAARRWPPGLSHLIRWLAKA